MVFNSSKAFRALADYIDNLWAKNAFGQSVLGKAIDREHASEVYFQIIDAARHTKDLEKIKSILDASAARAEPHLAGNLKVCFNFYHIKQEQMLFKKEVLPVGVNVRASSKHKI